MEKIGDVFVEVHADTKPIGRELDADLAHIAKDAEKGLDRTGTQFGEKIGDSTSKRLRTKGKDFGSAIEHATKNVIVRVRSIFRFDRIRDSIRRRFRRDVGEALVDEVSSAFAASTRKGGIFSRIGTTISDAVGAGFNVSGRSPLIAFLIPALAALVGVILAAVQAVNALVAVLFIIPGLLASIGLQVGVVFVAFQGMGEAIKGAFAAKNAKELRQALKGLTAPARDFVRELLPLRALFKTIGRVTQQAFFAELEGAVTAVRKSLGPSLIKGFERVGGAAGAFLNSFAALLASPGFKNFFNKLIPVTVRWLDMLAHSLFGKRGFITALIAMATALMPFMQRFGDIILRNLDHMSGLIFQLASSPETQTWLDRMAATLQLVFDLLFKVGEFLFVFMARLDEQGGQQIFTVLMEALDEIMFFLSSPAGAKAMEGLVNLGIIGIKTLAGLVIAILAVLAAFQFLSEWILDTGIPNLIKFLKFLGQGLVNFATFVGVWIQRIVSAIWGFLRGVAGALTNARNAVLGFVRQMVAKQVEFINKLRQLPGLVINAFRNFGSLLVNAGRSLIQGLINGVNQKVHELMSILSGIAGRIAGFFGHSPARWGPLSGKGWTLYRGQRIMQDLIKGIQMEIPSLREATMSATSNIVFGRGAIEMNFQGQPPTEAQARTAGAAVGQGAANMIAARNTRLAVRTL